MKRGGVPWQKRAPIDGPLLREKLIENGLLKPTEGNGLTRTLAPIDGVRLKVDARTKAALDIPHPAGGDFLE